MESLGKHGAKHDLPISNGWSGSSDRGVIVHCGRCKGYFTPDEAWANRYYDVKVRRLTERGGFDPFEFRALTDKENAQALAEVEADRKYLLSMLAAH